MRKKEDEEQDSILPEESQDGNGEQIADEEDVNDQARVSARRSQEEEFEDDFGEQLAEECQEEIMRTLKSFRSF
jgi:hypothetical protein